MDDVSITIERGRFVTLLGPSGSGKTTILTAVAGFITPSSGFILLDGADITRQPPEKRNFGMVFQGYALFPTMTVEENVWFPLRVRGMGRHAARRAVAASLALVKMEGLAERMPAQLSGGQQQRVALARALVFGPNLLLLDEPLSALDRQLRAELQWELRALHRRLGTTFINVTHDQEEALSMADEIVILRDGRVEQAGSPTALYARPATRFVAGFLGDSNFIEGCAVARDAGLLHVSIGHDTVLHVVGAAACAGPVTLALRPEKIALSTERPDTVNALRGTVADSSFHGSSYFVRVATAVAGTLIVKTPSWHGTDLTPGSQVWLGWQPDAAITVRDAG